MTEYKTKFWSVTKESQTPADPILIISQDTWDSQRINLDCASGTDTTVTLQLRVTDVIDNEAIYRNYKLITLTVEIKNIASPQLSLSSDLIIKGVTNTFDCKIINKFII